RLIGYLGDEAWKQPEVFEYAKEALRPSADMVRRDPWHGLQSGGIGYSTNGVVSSGMSRLLTAAAQANRLDELRTEVAAGVAEKTAWQAGPVLLALIDLKQKKNVDVEALAKPLLEATATGTSLMYTRLILAQELESRAEHRELAAQLYGLAVLNGSS